MFEFLVVSLAHAQMMRQVREAEEARLRAMTPEDRDFELRLREVRALEKIAKKEPTINITVRNSLFP